MANKTGVSGIYIGGINAAVRDCNFLNVDEAFYSDKEHSRAVSFVRLFDNACLYAAAVIQMSPSGSPTHAAFQLAAMSRADIAEQHRRDFYLYVDEFHNFTSESFASILSEARKYRLCMTLSHQYIDQLPLSIAAAVLGNVGSLISFRVGERDALALAREFGHGYNPGTFSGLGNHEVIAKLLERGEHAEPFVGRTMPPLMFGHGRRDNIIRRSREKYATPRHVVEGKLERWLNRTQF